MIIAHLADLHLGKMMNNYSLIEDQRYILNQIYEKMVSLDVDTVLIAGDIYDRPVPSAQAVSLLNDFLDRLVQAGMEVFIIAGNHDSGERLDFGRNLLDEMHVHITGSWDGKIRVDDLVDAYGLIHIWSLPFIRPSYINRYIDDEKQKVSTYTEAVSYALHTVPMERQDRNILIAHQFIAGTRVDEGSSEEIISAGGLDNVDPSVFEGFDYTALGHIHRAQAAGSQIIRYAGTPLKYSFQEADQTKSFTLIRLQEKGSIKISTIALQPMREVEVLRGSFEEISDPSFAKPHENHYVRVLLNDPTDIPDAIRQLKLLYPYIMGLEYERDYNEEKDGTISLKELKQKTPLEILDDFYEQRTSQKMTDAQRAYAGRVIDEIWKEEE